MTCPDDDEGGLDLVPPAIMGGAGAAMVKRAGAESAAVVRNADLSLSKVDDGSDPAASPWGLMGGLKGMGENLGAAIFNSKIQVNYQYKPEIKVGGAGGGAAGLSDLKAALLWRSQTPNKASVRTKSESRKSSNSPGHWKLRIRRARR